MKEDRYRDVEAALWTNLGLEPAEQIIDLPAPATGARVLEVGDGPPVLFVHGTTASGANWAPLAARLPGYRCLVLDRPGCGLSPPLERGFADIDAFAAWADRLVPDVLDGLGLDRARVVSTSLGSYLAIRSAAAHPERVERLAVVAFPMGAPVEELPFSMRLAGLPGMAAVMGRVPPTRGMVKSILGQLGMGAALRDGRISPDFFEWFVALLRHTRTMRNELATMPPIVTWRGELPAGMEHSDDTLAGLTMPTHFVWGAADPVGGAAIAEEFVPRVPGATLTLVPDGSHAPWVDFPEIVANEVGEFLAG